MERIDQSHVYLKHRLTPGQNDETLVRPLTPFCCHCICKHIGVSEAPAPGAVHPDKIGVAEFAHCAHAIRLAAGPQIAPGKAHEHRARARVRPFALQRQEYFLDRVAHTITA